ncbi:hypothetical protein V3C99_018489 [Haemonchus contortus]|uniref:Uncharacterized protein n=1 Tax=Haemonchus contortus TaxID=6289 RepID=A0A7I4Z267_HAECO
MALDSVELNSAWNACTTQVLTHATSSSWINAIQTHSPPMASSNESKACQLRKESGRMTISPGACTTTLNHAMQQLKWYDRKIIIDDEKL